MKSESKRKTALPKPRTQNPTPLTQKEFKFHLPPGVKLSDIFMDAMEVMQELKIGKRCLQNWRSQGKISYNDKLGKIYYSKVEIAEILMSGMKRNVK